MVTTAKEIKDLCESWVSAIESNGDSIRVVGDSERYRLLTNGVSFHDLNHEQLRAACLGLSRVLLLPRLNTIIHEDHQVFWSWCGEVLCGDPEAYFDHHEFDLRELMTMCCRGSLARRSETLEHNANEWLQRTDTAVAYLTFPLLEGLLKKSCGDFVTPSGDVLRNFDGKCRTYKAGGRCSSLRDLLELFSNEVASEDARRDLIEQKTHLLGFANPGEDGFDVLYRWRNSSLHGQTGFPTIAGTVLNTAFLVALSDLPVDYDHLRKSATARFDSELELSEFGSRSRWSYYPPYF